jgi:signal transduction histidine kinase
MKKVSLFNFFGLFILLLNIIVTVNAQNNYTSQHITQKEGLPQNSVNSVHFSKSGFLWLTTEAGLIRYDGLNFVSFQMANDTNIQNDRFKWILPYCHSQNVYAMASNGDLFELVDNKIVKRDLFKSSSSYIDFIGSIPNEFIKLNYIDNNKSFAHSPIISLALPNKTLCILGKSQILFFKKDSIASKVSFEGKNIVNLFRVNHHLYAKARNGDIYFVNRNTSQLQIVTLLNAKKIPSQIIYKSFSNKSYTFSDGKIFVLQATDNPKEIKLVQILNNLDENIEVTDIDVSSDNFLIAVGTKANGLFLFRKQLFTTIIPALDKKTLILPFYAITALNDSTIFSSNNQIFQNGRLLEQDVINNRLKIETVHANKKGGIWYAVNDSLFYFDLKTRNSSLAVFGYGSISTINLRGDSVLVGTTSQFFIYFKDKLLGHIATISDGKSDKVESVASTLEGRIFIASCKGVSELITTKTKWSCKPILPNRCVRYIWCDSNNRLFMCTYGNGMWVYSNNLIKKLPLDNKGYLNRVHNIQTDKYGQLWFSTNNGIINTKISMVEDFIALVSDKIFYTIYDTYDGLENAEMNGGCSPSGVQMGNGDIYFPSMYGMVKFNPSDFANQPIYNKIFVDNVLIDGLPIHYESSRIRIPANHERMLIRFVSPQWYNISSTHFEYKLSNYNKSYVALNRINPNISFTNLPSGSFKLSLIKFSNLDLNHLPVLNIFIQRDKDFYENVWFLIVVIVSLILTIYILINWNVNRLKKRNELLEHIIDERTVELKSINRNLVTTNEKLTFSETNLRQSVNVKNRLISILSHDIITPLKFIAMVARNVNNMQSTKEEITQTLKDIHHTSNLLYDNAQNILNWIKYQNNLIQVQKSNVAMYPLADQISELYEDPAAINGNIIQNLIDPDEIVHTDKNILSIIIHNLVANAVKYNKNCTIKLELFKRQSSVVIVVKDNGQGISELNLNRIRQTLYDEKQYTLNEQTGTHGLGFIIIKELTELINAHIQIDTKVGQGTTIQLILEQ